MRTLSKIVQFPKMKLNLSRSVLILIIFFATFMPDGSNCCKTYTSSVSFAIKIPHSGPKSEPEQKPKPKPEPEPKPKSDAEPKPESEPKPKSEAEPKPESEPKSESEPTELKSETDPARRKKRDLGTFLMMFDQLKSLAVRRLLFIRVST